MSAWQGHDRRLFQQVIEVDRRLHRVGARVWIARIMFTWGIISGAMALVQGPIGLYVLRFLPGAAEAGFFPGIILYLSYWYPARHRAGVTAFFMAPVPISIAIGSPISGALPTMDGILGLRGWQWLFLVEAAPAVLLTPVVLMYLTDRPENARWLDNEERDWHVVFACLFAAAGLVIAAFSSGLMLAVVALILVSAGVSSSKPPL